MYGCHHKYLVSISRLLLVIDSHGLHLQQIRRTVIFRVMALIGGHQLSTGTCYLHLQLPRFWSPWFIFVWSSFLKNLLPPSPATLKMKVTSYSMMVVIIYKSICCHSPQYHKLHDLLTEVKRVQSPASCNKGTLTTVFCCHPLVAVSDSRNSITLAVPELKN